MSGMGLYQFIALQRKNGSKHCWGFMLSSHLVYAQYAAILILRRGGGEGRCVPEQTLCFLHCLMSQEELQELYRNVLPLLEYLCQNRGLASREQETEMNAFRLDEDASFPIFFWKGWKNCLGAGGIKRGFLYQRPELTLLSVWLHLLAPDKYSTERYLLSIPQTDNTIYTLHMHHTKGFHQRLQVAGKYTVSKRLIFPSLHLRKWLPRDFLFSILCHVRKYGKQLLTEGHRGGIPEISVDSIYIFLPLPFTSFTRLNHLVYLLAYPFNWSCHPCIDLISSYAYFRQIDPNQCCGFVCRLSMEFGLF